MRRREEGEQPISNSWADDVGLKIRNAILVTYTRRVCEHMCIPGTVRGGYRYIDTHMYVSRTA